MTTKTHTPGPWEASGIVFSGPDGMIGEVGFGMRDDEEMVANARLIAAAPDLLEAGQVVIQLLNDYQHPRRGRDGIPAWTRDKDWDTIRAAIAKATP